MKCPKKMYLVVSRKLKGMIVEPEDVYIKRKHANATVKYRNKHGEHDVDDWRVEVYVKGD